jgi:hypothetical protein
MSSRSSHRCVARPYLIKVAKWFAPRSVQNNSEQRISEIGDNMMTVRQQMNHNIDQVCFVDMFHQQAAPAASYECMYNCKEDRSTLVRQLTGFALLQSIVTFS